MFTAARRCVSNALSGVLVCGCNRYSPNLVTGCYIKKLTRTANGSGGGFKAVVTTALLFIMGALYCLYGTGGSTGGTVTPVAYSQQSLGSSDSAIGVQSDAAIATMDGGNLHTNLGCGGNGKKGRRKQQKIKPPNSVVTAADMYEPGFRIQNAGLCSTSTRLLVLITSAAAPAHSQNRQAIRMTWMNRYGPSVSMAFLVGTPQMAETDPVARVLEAEEQALQTRLNQHDINNNIKPKENTKSKPPIVVASASADTGLKPPNGDPGHYQFLKEPNPGEGLDAHAMHGLNEAERAVQRVLGREYGRYGDLVQCQSRDTYTNLTLKSIAALEWTRQYCPWARYLLKTDDDMFIDIRRLLRFINKVETDIESNVSGLHSRPVEPIRDPYELLSVGADMFETVNSPSFDIELPPTIWGRLAHGWRPIRQQNSKYYVSRTQYTGRVYPDFCTGPAYLMTRSAVGPLYEAALGKDFDIVDDEDEGVNQENKNNINEVDDDVEGQKYMGKDCGDSNQTFDASDNNLASNVYVSKNTVPYLKLEDVYLTGVVAERLTLRANERQVRRELKEKEKISLNAGDHNQKLNRGKVMVNHDHLDGGKNTRLKTADIIVKVRRIHNDQFANKKITGRALDRAVCSGLSPSDTVGTSGSSGFSWFRWYWGDTALDKDSKKKKKDQGVISLHMVKYYEQFDLWRRLMDGRTKCKS